MKSIVIGAGRLGVQIARALTESGQDVTLVEIDPRRVEVLPRGLAARVVTGDGCEPYLLEEAGVLNADLVVPATGDDEDNLVISLLAKRQFNVGRVVARVNDSDNGWLFDARWGVDAAVPSAAPLISLIEEANGSTAAVSLLRLGRAGVNLVETVIGATAMTAGRPLSDIDLPPRSIVAAVIRDGTPTVPDASYVLRGGDELLVLAETATREQIQSAFA